MLRTQIWVRQEGISGALAPIVVSQEEASRQHYGIQHMEMVPLRDDGFESAVDANEIPRRGIR